VTWNANIGKSRLDANAPELRPAPHPIRRKIFKGGQLKRTTDAKFKRVGPFLARNGPPAHFVEVRY
jgi:hypothetical protein